MYIGLLPVAEEYRGSEIGKNFMCRIEEKAEELNV